MNLKRFSSIFILFSALVSSQSFGVLADHVTVNRSHFLLGASAGYASRSGDLVINITHPAPTSVRSDHVRDQDDTGFLFNLFVGYEWIIDEFLFGIETSLGFQDFGDDQRFAYLDAQSPQNGYNGTSKFSRDLVWSLSGRFGYELAPWIRSYIRLGAETSDDNVYLQSTRGAPLPISVLIDEGRRTVRFLGGFGFEFPMMYSTTLRLEYQYSSRGKGASNTAFASDNLTVFSPNIKPVQHALYLGFAWNFNPEQFVKSSA